MADTKDPNQIEREIDQERDELAGTLDELQNRFSPEHLLREIGRGLSEHSGDIGHAISGSVKRNPVALALTGIGLAWLISGRSWDDQSSDSGERRHATERHGTRVGPLGSAHPAEPLGNGHHDPASWYWADEDRSSDREDDDPSMGERVSDAAAGARDSASSAASATKARARRVRQRLSHGTDDMTDAARERVVAARWQAVKARRRAARYARRGADGVSRFVDDNPLVAGGLAVAVGAALAGGLPRTRQEDAWFGERSDRAFDEAERIFDEERQKAAKVAERAVDEASDVADEKLDQLDRSAPGGRSAAEQATDEVRHGVGRVAGAAKDEAKKRDLGQQQRP